MSTGLGAPVGEGGLPLLLLHGFTGSPASWEPVLAARPSQGDPPAPPLRPLRPALLGHRGVDGRVVGPAGEDGPGAFLREVDRLAALVRGAAPPGSGGPVHLVGYSLGARLGLGLLVRHPELFRAATLVSGHPGLEDAAARADRRRSDEGWARLLETEGLDPFVARWEALPLFATQEDRATPEALAAQRRIRRGQDPRGLARALRALGLGEMPPFWSALPTIDRPVSFLVGERDPKFVALAERAAPMVPRGTLHRLPGVGHNVLLESPGALWETVLRSP
jgi:2-succinyl-6-hydroxy-2,4-cyclohexadiene-1-carboxylate synthase